MKNLLFNLSHGIPFLLILFTAACSKAPVPVVEVVADETQPAMQAKNIDVLFSDSGKIQARLTGPIMNRYAGETPFLELPNGFAVSMFDSVRNVTTTITGNRAVRYENRRVMEAWGNVVVTNNVKKERLNTEHLLWDEGQHRIWADGKVKITTPDKVLNGSKMESNDSFTDYSIFNPTGQMKLNRDSL